MASVVVPVLELRCLQVRVAQQLAKACGFSHRWLYRLLPEIACGPVVHIVASIALVNLIGISLVREYCPQPPRPSPDKVVQPLVQRSISLNLSDGIASDLAVLALVLCDLLSSLALKTEEYCLDNKLEVGKSVSNKLLSFLLRLTDHILRRRKLLHEGLESLVAACS